jgi:hypothetical protein
MSAASGSLYRGGSFEYGALSHMSEMGGARVSFTYYTRCMRSVREGQLP